MSTQINTFANLEHQHSLDLLAETLKFLNSWPYHPATQEKIRAIESHLKQPGLEVIKKGAQVEAAARKRFYGETYRPAGEVVLRVELVDLELTITAPAGREGADDALLLRRLRSGEKVQLKHEKNSKT